MLSGELRFKVKFVFVEFKRLCFYVFLFILDKIELGVGCLFFGWIFFFFGISLGIRFDFVGLGGSGVIWSGSLGCVRFFGLGLRVLFLYRGFSLEVRRVGRRGYDV